MLKLMIKLIQRIVTHVTVGETTGLIAVASDTLTPISDNANGNVHWEYLQGMKAIATVGEVDKTTGFPMTGWPDGLSARAWRVELGKRSGPPNPPTQTSPPQC